MTDFVPMDFECVTPLGRARCRGMWPEGDTTTWLTDIHATREAWWWQNEDFRFGATVTSGSGPSSPFRTPNANLVRQIKRYKDNGWIHREPVHIECTAKEERQQLRTLSAPAIDKTKLYTILSKSIPADMIDDIWQELNQ